MDERAELVTVRSGPRVDIEAGVGAHSLFERQAAATPDRVALRSDATSVSYAELNARANRLAHHLLGLGVSRGDAVGVLLERSVDLVVAVFAVLKAGAAYVPLDPALPADRFGYMIDGVRRPRWSSPTRSRALRTSAVVLRRRRWCWSMETPPISRACSAHEPGSGDLEHRSCAHHLHVGFDGAAEGRRGRASQASSASCRPWLPSRGISADDVVLAGTTLSFDPSVLELFLPLDPRRADRDRRPVTRCSIRPRWRTCCTGPA